MRNHDRRTLVLLAAMLLLPAALRATRGPDDYGLFMVAVFFLFSFPVGMMLIGFIIYSLVKLKGVKKPEPGQGRVVFVLSVVTAALSVIIFTGLTHKTNWNGTMLQVMLGDCLPVFLLSVISAVLAVRVGRGASPPAP